jgi:hypothetical protein
MITVRIAPITRAPTKPELAVKLLNPSMIAEPPNVKIIPNI